MTYKEYSHFMVSLRTNYTPFSLAMTALMYFVCHESPKTIYSITIQVRGEALSTILTLLETNVARPKTINMSSGGELSSSVYWSYFR